MTYYRLRMRYHELCYVERDAIVEAANPREARQKALDNDLVDSGEDHCCEPVEVDTLGIADEYSGGERKPELMPADYKPWAAENDSAPSVAG